MTSRFPDHFDDYVEFISTNTITIKHWVVRVANTPAAVLDDLREFDRQQFEYDGEHAIEFLEE